MDRVSGSPDVSVALGLGHPSLADQLINLHTAGGSVDIDGLAKDVAALKGHLAPYNYEGLKQEVGSKLPPFDSGHFSQALANAEPAASGQSQASGPAEKDKPHTATAGSTANGTTAARQHAAKAHQPRPKDTSLGHLAAGPESGGDPGAVSPGKGDHGGVSYGTYQIIKANVGDFLKHEGSQWSAEFAGKTPGTTEFTKAWKDIANRDPKAFQEAQHKYIERSHYTPMVDAVRQATNVDISQHSKTLQNVVWSAAVQQGPYSPIVTAAINKVIKKRIKPDNPDFDRRVINAIYDERGRTNAKGQVVHFRSSSPATQQNQIARFGHERLQALRELRAERRTGSNSSQPEKGL